MKKLKKIFVFCFCFLVAMGNSVFTFGQSGDNKRLKAPAKNALSGKRYGNIEDILKKSDTPSELFEKRTRTSKQFINEDGTVSFIASSGVSLNYLEKNQWKTVKNDIIKSNEKSGWGYANLDNEFKTYISESSNKGLLVDFAEGSVSEWEDPYLAWTDLQGKVISKRNVINTVNANVSSNSFVYKSVYSGIDAKFIIDNGGKKMEYIINDISDLNDLPSNANYLVFYETIRIPSGWTATTHHKGSKHYSVETNSINNINNIVLRDNNGKVIITYTRPHFFDNDLRGGIDGEYFFEQINNKLKIGIKVPVSWLVDTNRTFPLVIDPTNNYYNYNAYKTTGYVYDDGDFGDDGIVMGFDDIWYANFFINSWSEFNLSTFPGGQTLTAAYLYLYKTGYTASGSNNYIAANVGRMTTRPSTYVDNQQLYDDIFNAPDYGYIELFSSDPNGWLTWDLFSVQSSINADITGSAGSWFSLGYNAATTGTESSDPAGPSDDNFFFASGYSSANRPFLQLVYCVAPSANAGPDQNSPGICNTTPANQATLAGNAPGAGKTGLWTVVSGSGTFTDATLNTTTVICGQGTNVYKWTLTVTDGGCTHSDNVQIINNTPTVPDAGTNGSTCNGTYSLNGNNPSYGTGVWSVVSGTGVFSNSGLYNSQVSGLTGSDAGTANTYRWTISINGCSKTDDVIITYYLPPTASVASSPLTGCWNTATLTLNGNNPASLTPPGTGAWTVISGSGTFTNSILYNTTVSNVGTPTNTYRWIVSRSGCSSYANVVVNNSSPSAANAGPDQFISSGSTTMQGNNPTQGTGTWTVSPSAGVTITSPNLYNTTVTGLSSSTLYTFTWTIAFGGCTPTTDVVTVFWDPGQLGFIIQDNLTNDGTFDQTNETNDFIMNGTNKFIYGGVGAISNTYSDTKLKIYGTITFDGYIDNGKFTRTIVQPTKTFTIANSKTYKNGTFTSNGTTNLNASSFFENSANWTNSSTVTADATSTVKFNGSAAQEVTSGGSQFGHVEIINTVVPAPTNGVKLMDNMSINSASNLTLTDGMVIANSKNLIVNNTANSAVTYGGTNSTYTDSWVYGTSTGALRRYFANSSNGEYAIPVGSATRGNLAIINNNSLPSATPFYVDGYFISGVIAGINTSFPGALNEGASIYQNVLGADASEGVWSLTESGTIDGTYDLKLYYNGFAGALADGQFCILSRPSDPGNGSTWAIPAGSSFVIKTAASGFAHRTGMNSFSHKGIGRTPAPLPIELISFSGVCKNHLNHLIWVSGSETNNDFFTLERSADAEVFSPLAEINGAGNSHSDLSYQYIDSDPLPGINFYKLKQTDFDGSFSYSGVVAVNECSNGDDVTIYSENFDEVIISINSSSGGLYTVTFYDAIGNVVQEALINVSKGVNVHSMQLKNLATGIYYINLRGENEKFSQKVFVR